MMPFPSKSGHAKNLVLDQHRSAHDLVDVPANTFRAKRLIRPFYLIYAFATLSTIQIPWWFLRYLLPRFRVKGDTRSLFRLVWVRVIRRFLEISVKARIAPPAIHLAPKSLKSSIFVWIPILPDRYVKHSAATPNANGIMIPPSRGHPGSGKLMPAFWYAPPGERLDAMRGVQQHIPAIHASSGAKAQPGMILFLHGGAYVGLTAHEADPATALVKSLTRITGLDVLAVEYRLATIEAYPAQLQDAAAAWVHLVSPTESGGLGIPANKVIILGDSAGGNLCIALLRWLDQMSRSGDAHLGKPKGVMLLSPWVDLTSGLAVKSPYPDIVANVYGDFGRSSLLRTHDPQMAYDPLISPYFDTPEELGDVFAHSRVYVAAGGCEVLRPEIEAFVGTLRRGKRGVVKPQEGRLGEDVQIGMAKSGTMAVYLGHHLRGISSETDGVVLDVCDEMPHDWPVIPLYGNESVALWKRVGAWMKDVLEEQ